MIFFRTKKEENIEVYDISYAKNILRQKQKVWAWVETYAISEWREVIYDGDDLCLKYNHIYYVDYSLQRCRRLPQNVKYFTLSKNKPKIKFKSKINNENNINIYYSLN